MYNKHWNSLTPEQRYNYDWTLFQKAKPDKDEWDFLFEIEKRYRPRWKELFDKKKKRTEKEGEEMTAVLEFLNYTSHKYGLMKDFRCCTINLLSFIELKRQKIPIHPQRIFESFRWYDHPELGNISWLSRNIEDPDSCLKGIWDKTRKFANDRVKKFFLERLKAHNNYHSKYNSDFQYYPDELRVINDGIDELINENSLNLSQRVLEKRRKGEQSFKKWRRGIKEGLEAYPTIKGKIKYLKERTKSLEYNLYSPEKNLVLFATDPERFEHYHVYWDAFLSLQWVNEQIKYLSQKVESPIQETEPITIIKPKLKLPTALAETLKNEADLEIFKRTLTEVSPPLIDGNGNWIGKLKGGIAVAIEEFKFQGYLNKISLSLTNDQWAAILNREFPGLEITGRHFGNHHTKATSIFKPQFLQSIPKKQ